MFRVDDIYDEAKKIVGICDDVKFFRWASDAVSLIANKGDFEGWKGTVDICTSCSCSTSSGNVCHQCKSNCVTLPAEVETVLAVNIGGHPTLGLGELFNFHLNGPGDCHTALDWSWQDLGHYHSTFKDIVTPAKVVTYLKSSADNGKQFIVYGFDVKGDKLRRQVSGQWLDGYQVPTTFGYSIPDSEAPTIARITGIFKEPTTGPIRLSTVDNDGPNGTLLGVYQPDETVPQYRRIKLNRCSSWVRVAYMKANPKFVSRYDHVPLQSRIAFLLAIRAVKMYADFDLANAHALEADSVRLEIEAQQKLQSPTYFPIQVVDRNNLRDKSDYDIR